MEILNLNDFKRNIQKGEGGLRANTGYNCVHGSYSESSLGTFTCNLNPSFGLNIYIKSSKY